MWTGRTIADSASGIAGEVEAGNPVVTDDPTELCGAHGIDVICDVTGAVEFGAAVTLPAFEAAKHVVTMNAELDGTVGALSRPWGKGGRTGVRGRRRRPTRS